MIHSAIKTTAVFAAAWAGLAFHADACPRRRTPATEKPYPEVRRVAIAGLLDIDNDGKSDREVIRRIINLNGGQIDAELRMDGELTGELRRDTGYIILGELPDETTLSPRAAKQLDAFLRRARELGIPVVPMRKLLFSGDRSRRAQAGADSVFRPRQPPRRPSRQRY
jgi:hypothetical protein